MISSYFTLSAIDIFYFVKLFLRQHFHRNYRMSEVSCIAPKFITSNKFEHFPDHLCVCVSCNLFTVIIVHRRNNELMHPSMQLMHTHTALHFSSRTFIHFNICSILFRKTILLKHRNLLRGAHLVEYKSFVKIAFLNPNKSIISTK